MSNNGRKRILVSAIACNPYWGSEALHGWLACRSLALLGEIWVLAHESNREGIEKAIAAGIVPDSMHFVFAGKNQSHSKNRLLARLQGWWHYMAYWPREILSVAYELHEKHRFDLAHHVTYSTWRVESPLWRLGIPLIWGPISGTEKFPLTRFWPILSMSGRLFEMARICGGFFSHYLTPGVALCAKNSYHIFAAHKEAVAFLSELRGSAEGITVQSYYSFSPQDIEKLARPRFEVSDRPLKILAGGNLEGRKGVAIALEALGLAKKSGVKFSYRITGNGPERQHLQKLAEQLGIAGDVTIGQGFSREEYLRELKETDIYLLPSLREGGGLTMMEAMLSGCVPIVADAGGPGTAVDNGCGFKIPVKTSRQMAEEIRDAIVYLDRNRKEIAEMGARAAQRIAGNYTESRFNEVMKECYERAVSLRKEGAGAPVG